MLSEGKKVKALDSNILWLLFGTFPHIFAGKMYLHSTKV